MGKGAGGNGRTTRAIKLAQQGAKWGTSREEAAREYERMARQGRIRAPTRMESLRTAARGHPDLAATQAARRLLAKQGINW